jgi:DNA-binding response OmpR family regulator
MIAPRGSVRGLVLARLAAGRGAVVSYEALCTVMYSSRIDAAPDGWRNILRVMINRLRTELPGGAITMHHGLGYSLRADVAAQVQQIDARELVPRE